MHCTVNIDSSSTKYIRTYDVHKSARNTSEKYSYSCFTVIEDQKSCWTVRYNWVIQAHTTRYLMHRISPDCTFLHMIIMYTYGQHNLPKILAPFLLLYEDQLQNILPYLSLSTANEETTYHYKDPWHDANGCQCIYLYCFIVYSITCTEHALLITSLQWQKTLAMSISLRYRYGKTFLQARTFTITSTVKPWFNGPKFYIFPHLRHIFCRPSQSSICLNVLLSSI